MGLKRGYLLMPLQSEKVKVWRTTHSSLANYDSAILHSITPIAFIITQPLTFCFFLPNLVLTRTTEDRILRYPSFF